MSYALSCTARPSPDPTTHPTGNRSHRPPHSRRDNPADKRVSLRLSLSGTGPPVGVAAAMRTGDVSADDAPGPSPAERSNLGTSPRGQRSGRRDGALGDSFHIGSQSDPEDQPTQPSRHRQGQPNAHPLANRP